VAVMVMTPVLPSVVPGGMPTVTSTSVPNSAPRFSGLAE
jgi:hypothetical protein